MTAAIAGIAFARDAADCAGADVVIVDLARFAASVGDLRRALPDARIVTFGPHVDEDAATEAHKAGADAVLPRSLFFRDPAAAVAGSR
jgi:DNA-binding NarL/FixJ family response regulator